MLLNTTVHISDCILTEADCTIHMVEHNPKSGMIDAMIVRYDEPQGELTVNNTLRIQFFNTKKELNPAVHLTQVSQPSTDMCRVTDWTCGEEPKRLSIYSGTKTMLMQCKTNYMFYDRLSPKIDCVELGYEILSNGQVISEHTKFIAIEKR